MRIAQVAPLMESVPPKLYGGTERVVSYLTEELVGQGHEVVLFATADSRTAALLEPCAPEGLRLAPELGEPSAYYAAMLRKVFERRNDFDVIHFHIDAFHYPLLHFLPKPHLTTHHGRLDVPHVLHLHEQFDGFPVVSISLAQREPIPHVNWRANVYHGLPTDLYSPGRGGEYLAFLGRISPEKGIEDAVAIAGRAGIPLKVAAKVDPADAEYYEEVVRPLLRSPGVEYIGEVNEGEKQELLGGALALVCPIRWPEPFGMVIIEAMACGTPVIAFRRGSVPELVDDGVSGLIVDNVDQALAAVDAARGLNRLRVRQVFEQRFAASRMAADYVGAYLGEVQPSDERVAARIA
jgi:glycosyltransferase involved in cell wall biosynthesis